MNIVTKRLEWGGEEIIIETGKLARQADGSVMLRQGDTILLAAVTAKKDIDPKVDFLPLSVDYKEHYASTGKIPGGFFKRDGRLNEHEILTSRLIDRALRPLFPEDYHGDIQMIVTVFSADKSTKPDALATVAACAALMVSDIPFPDPVASVRMGLIDGAFVVNPKAEQMDKSLMDIMVSGTPDSIVMVEGEMREVSEEQMLEAFQIAHESIKKLCGVLVELRQAAGKPTREYTKPEVNEELVAKVKAFTYDKLFEIAKAQQPKQERSKAFKELYQSLVESLKAEKPEITDDELRQVKAAYGQFEYEVVRKLILDNNVRLDGRKPEDIRQIWCEHGILPRAHGSSLFTRGETQSLTSVTLGTKLDEQTIDYATAEGTKKFMLQYNFPPYSTGEVKPMRAPSRREIGHGNLAERALKNMIPEDNDYTIRVVSEILESNGSSSMATVCAGTMALMDAGIKIKGAVSGIAMGLIIEDGKYAVLSDILGDEDHLGDMDFKVTGTSKGLTACQMDIKVRGLSFEILHKALQQSKAGRAHILGEMLKCIDAPREDFSAYAPRFVKIDIPTDMIGAVIGPGGKVVQEIQRSTNTEVLIEEVPGKGVVTIASPDKSCLDAAKQRIMEIVAVPEIGKVYEAKVKFIKEAGAVLEFMPNKEGWLHISEISYSRIPSMEGVLEVGEVFPVKYLGPDPKNGKLRLSRKALLPPPEGGDEREQGGARFDRGGGGDRGLRGPRRDGGGFGGPRRDGGGNSPYRGGGGDRNFNRDNS